MKLSNTPSDYLRPILTGALAGMALAIAFVAGFYFRGIVAKPTEFVNTVPPDQVGYPLVDEVQLLLDQIFLREQPDYATRQYGAIRGLLGTLDERNTFFIEPPVAQSEADVLAGTYGGIGVFLRLNEMGDYILQPFPASPAYEIGIREGAILVAINGEAIILGDSLDSLDQMMRGEVKIDSGVELTIRQDETEQTLFIEFAVINVPSVLWRVLEADERIAYLQILRFTNRTPDEVLEGMEALIEAGTTALVLDLRNNSGGLLEESITVADQFLDSGVIIYQVSRDDERIFNAENGGLATEQALIVLVNDRTASAAELVAGAIQDNGRGILIGQSTFGKGTVQQIFSLSDGSSIHITSAEWLTPNRTPIAGLGLTPDIEMIPDENGRDVELGEALRYLQEQLESVAE
jgi:carboxyl-terminal processing protease